MSVEQKPQPRPSRRKQELPNEAVALQIYSQLAITNRSYSMQSLAEHSFALAAAFTAEAKRIADGGEVVTTMASQPVPDVTIIPWSPGTEYGQFGEPITDEFGRYVTQTVKGDPYCHHPNLPATHPHNQRYFLARSEMGLPMDERYKRALKEHQEMIESAA